MLPCTVVKCRTVSVTCSISLQHMNLQGVSVLPFFLCRFHYVWRFPVYSSKGFYKKRFLSGKWQHWVSTSLNQKETLALTFPPQIYWINSQYVCKINQTTTHLNDIVEGKVAVCTTTQLRTDWNDVYCCVLFQIHSDTTTAFVRVQEFNTTYSVEVAACTQAGSGMVSPRVWLFVPEDSKLLYWFISSSGKC